MGLNKDNCVLVVVDLQEKLVKAMDDFDVCLKKCQLLVQSANIFNIPILVTEQYPKGLGGTIEDISSFLHDRTSIYAKTAFSCCRDEEFNKALLSLGKKNVILCGIESHVCVLQTAMDLLGRGMNVYLAADGVTSRNANDKSLALAYMRHNNVSVLSAESLVFVLLGDAKAPEFKAVSALVR